MCFRDLHDFNIALLGKQIWRLIQSPESLLALVLRSRYFPSGNILEAKSDRRASFAWRGIWQAMHWLQPGFFWRPGIDSRIRIHRDRWGGSSGLSFFGTYQDNEELPLRCRDFMLRNQNAWDDRKIRDYFDWDDAANILKVPISAARRDILLWGFHDTNIYTARSGYLFLRRPSRPLARPCPLWKAIAKSPTLPKIRTFGWRAGRNALPTGDRLAALGMGDGICPFCPTIIETAVHALRDCPGATEVLHLAGFPRTIYGSTESSIALWLERGASLLSRTEFSLLLTIIWNTWNRRNDWVHSQRLQPPWLTLMNSYELLQDYVSATSTNPTAHAQTDPALPRLAWRPPPAGRIKINVDSAFNPVTGAAGFGIVARDATDSILLGRDFFSDDIPDSSSAELLAIVAGVSLGSDAGWHGFHLESDTAMIINKLRNPDHDASILHS
ncbi:hypothetical protein like AT4G29090 [Hibiscus trionum]|uniref:RNase H type-1 domain-containing protein n=1 Tax=Hibiscus trionum TaxID=183268 RepID=A0A9W7JA03_HIBTR|nr:hypothetical protein like AT4G29090 [Hibiscus trionum]